MTDAPPEHRPALDGIRAIAVLAVIGYHLNYGWASGGYLGVDVFFVLSGYLITGILFRVADPGGRALLTFWVRRIRRLLPALILVLLAVAIAAATFTPATELSRLRIDAFAGLFYFANWRFITSGQSYFDLFSAPSPLRHLWSLAIEEQFYLVWPLVTLAALRWTRHARAVVGIVCVAGITGSAVLMAVLYDSHDPSRAYYGTDARIHTILVGCLLALIVYGWPRAVGPRRSLQALGLLLAAAMLGVMVAGDDRSAIFYRGGSLAFAVLVALVIVCSERTSAGPLNHALALSPLTWVGRISYGLYLWHWPLIVWLTPDRVGFGGWQLDALRIALTFGLAAASFYLVEQPIRNGTMFHRQRWSTRLAWPAALAAMALLLVASTSGAEPLPTYLTGDPPFACSTPSPAEHQAALDALRLQESPPRAVPFRHLLLVGDSTACSMSVGLSVVGPRAGVEVTDASIKGCGVVSDEVRGVLPTDWSRRCHRAVADVTGQAFASARPDLVLWASAWERNSIVRNGEVLAAGTPEWEAELRRRIARTVDQFAAGGARVVFVSQAPFQKASGAYAAPFTQLNNLLRRFVVDHPDDTSYVDLAEQVCPGDAAPCPAKVDGIVLRPFDGAHFGPAGSVFAARWLLRAAAGT